MVFTRPLHGCVKDTKSDIFLVSSWPAQSQHPSHIESSPSFYGHCFLSANYGPQLLSHSFHVWVFWGGGECDYVYSHLCWHMCVHMQRGPKLMLRVLLDHFLPYSPRQSVSIKTRACQDGQFHQSMDPNLCLLTLELQLGF